MVKYLIEITEPSGRCIARFDKTPLLQAGRGGPDVMDVIEGILPFNVKKLQATQLVRVFIDGRLFCEAPIAKAAGHWGDSRRLILDRYVNFHELLNIRAERGSYYRNGRVSRLYRGRDIGAIVKNAINSAPGAIHYTVAHGAYPEGTRREYQKFLARKTPENELEAPGILLGDWVGPGRINAGGAYAKDGDTIAGLVVDGIAWPDVRLMMIDSEEMGKNSHAIKRHPEVAHWTAEQYLKSGYALKARAAKSNLQALLDADDIDYIELNPHKDVCGGHDDRVDVYGRYIALIYGGGKCFNAAQVERGVADVYLWEDGRYHVPEMELKDYFSYGSTNIDSIEICGETLSIFDMDGGVMEALTALSYAGGGYIWSIGVDGAVSFRRPDVADHVIHYDPLLMSVSFGSADHNLCNVLYYSCNPAESSFTKTYRRSRSGDEYGAGFGRLGYYPISQEADADKLVEGLLNDIAYPSFVGEVIFHRGTNDYEVGDLVELRGAPLSPLDERQPEEWGGRYADKWVFRVNGIIQRFAGSRVSTILELTSPLRSVMNPLSVMVRNQEAVTKLYEFRLDDESVGLDMSYHVD